MLGAPGLRLRAWRASTIFSCLVTLARSSRICVAERPGGSALMSSPMPEMVFDMVRKSRNVMSPSAALLSMSETASSRAVFFFGSSRLPFGVSLSLSGAGAASSSPLSKRSVTVFNILPPSEPSGSRPMRGVPAVLTDRVVGRRRLCASAASKRMAVERRIGRGCVSVESEKSLLILRQTDILPEGKHGLAHTLGE